jgi:hypothetical protein
MKGTLLFLIWMSTTANGTAAWTVPSSYKTRNHRNSRHSTTLLASSSAPDATPEMSSRRQWITNIASATVGAGFIPLLPANAEAADIVTSAAVCDPSVSVWSRDGRLIYLLGTAHVSAASAELAGNLVKDILPKAIFVELDVKRIGGSGILANRVRGVGTEDASAATDGPTSEIIIPQISRTGLSQPASSASDSVESSSNVAVAPTAALLAAATNTQPNPLMRAASAVVGNTIKGMYKKLDSAGFNAGEEFVVTIKEAQKIGSAIILGDRDVEVTLRRVTEGLAKTDLNALLNPDGELEQSMRELVPSQTASRNGGGDLNDPQFRDEFSTFVESIKTKENVRKIMGQLQRTAPALYEALVTERDAYMAAGLNGLNQFDTIVAVMGIAHVDGVESNLSANGWKLVNLKCAGSGGQRG